MATTTPNYGWDVPTSTDYVKDGATAIETLGDDIDATLWTALGGAYPGLRLVKKQTIGSAVSSISVTNCFNATYENYKVLITGGVGSATGDFGWYLTQITANYYTNLVNQSWGTATVSGAVQSNAASSIWIGGYSTTGMYAEIELQSPFLSKITTAQHSNYSQNIAGGSVGRASTLINNTTSATGLTITTGGGQTVTGGTIYVYGYGAS